MEKYDSYGYDKLIPIFKKRMDMLRGSETVDEHMPVEKKMNWNVKKDQEEIMMLYTAQKVYDIEDMGINMEIMQDKYDEIKQEFAPFMDEMPRLHFGYVSSMRSYLNRKDDESIQSMFLRNPVFKQFGDMDQSFV